MAFGIGPPVLETWNMPMGTEVNISIPEFELKYLIQNLDYANKKIAASIIIDTKDNIMKY